MRQIDSPWLTLPQGARYIQMPPQEFRELVYAGKIPSHKRSEKRIFVHRADLDAMMFGLPSAAVVPEMMRSVASS